MPFRTPAAWLRNKLATNTNMNDLKKNLGRLKNNGYIKNNLNGKTYSELRAIANRFIRKRTGNGLGTFSNRHGNVRTKVGNIHLKLNERKKITNAIGKLKSNRVTGMSIAQKLSGSYEPAIFLNKIETVKNYETFINRKLNYYARRFGKTKQELINEYNFRNITNANKLLKIRANSRNARKLRNETNSKMTPEAFYGAQGLSSNQIHMIKSGNKHPQTFGSHIRTQPGNHRTNNQKERNEKERLEANRRQREINATGLFHLGAGR